MSNDEQDRHRKAREELTVKLSDVLQFALSCGLTPEASIIAKLIDTTILNTTINLIVKLK